MRRADVPIPTLTPPQRPPSAGPRAGSADRRLAGALEIPMDQLVEDPDQPRRSWGEPATIAQLADLAGSIKEFGILQPLVAREDGALPDGRQRYRLIAGARRYRAAQMAGLQALPVMVRDGTAARIQVLQLVENLQRQDLEPLEEAQSYKALMDLEGLTPPQLATRVHITAQHVRDRLRLLDDQVLADAVERRQIAASVARSIQQLPDEEYAHYRTRVQAGERLRGNDLARVRARLAAQGTINPRLDRRRSPAQAPASGVPPAGAVGSEPSHTVPHVTPSIPSGAPATGPALDTVAGETRQTVFASAAEPHEAEPKQAPHLEVPLTVQRWQERAGRLDEGELTEVPLADLVRLHPQADLPALRALLASGG